MKYSPRVYDDSAINKSMDHREEEYPTAHIDVPPACLKELEVGESVTIVIKAKLEGMRYDTDDSWGTGASINLSLRDIDVKGKASDEESDIIDSMLDED